MNQKKYLALALVGVCLASVFFYLHFREPVLAKVGSTSISKKDAALRDRIILLDFPDEKRSMGLYQLINAAIDYEILRRHHVAPSEGMLEAEEARIDANTKDPKKLQQIKELFGGDSAAYRRVFIRPAFVQRTIYYDFFLNNEEVQSQASKRAQSLIEKLKKDPSQFEKIAESENLPVRKATLSKHQGLVWELEKQLAVQSKKALPPHHLDEAKKWLETFTKNLNSGDVVPVPLNVGQNLLILRLLKKNKEGDVEVQAAVVAKASFDNWRATERVAIPIEIFDHSYPVPDEP